MKKRNNTVTQAGRSAIEMFGVLGIVGILTVIGVVSYRHVASKAKKQELDRYISTLVVKGRTKALDGQIPSETLVGPFNIPIEVRDGTGDKASYFSIEVNLGQNDRLCEDMKRDLSISPNLILVNGVINGPCPGSIRYYYERNLNYPNKALAYVLDGVTHLCPEHAVCTENSFSCESGYYANNDSCSSCGSGAATCTDASTATSCQEGHYLSEGACPEVPENATVNEEGNGFNCNDYYYKFGNECAHVPEHATINEEGTGFDCNDGYYKSGSNCLAVPPNATRTPDGNGFSCNPGYLGVTCSEVDLCYGVSCGAHGSCNGGTCICTDNYFGNNCENAPLTCQNGGTWDTTNHVCSCVNNYYGNTCETAPLTCQNGGTWNTSTHQCDCQSGYTGTTCETVSCSGWLDNNGNCCTDRSTQACCEATNNPSDMSNFWSCGECTESGGPTMCGPCTSSTIGTTVCQDGVSYQCSSGNRWVENGTCGSCTSNAQCTTPGMFCKMSSASSGTCEAVSDYGTAGADRSSQKMNYWSAQNWCAASAGQGLIDVGSDAESSCRCDGVTPVAFNYFETLLGIKKAYAAAPNCQAYVCTLSSYWNSDGKVCTYSSGYMECSSTSYTTQAYAYCQPSSPCSGVDCGDFGTCSNGVCVCDNGTTSCSGSQKCCPVIVDRTINSYTCTTNCDNYKSQSACLNVHSNCASTCDGTVWSYYSGSGTLAPCKPTLGPDIADR